MKTLMLNHKSKMMFNQIKTYVTDLKIYQKKFVVFPTNIYAKDFIDSGYITGVQNIAEKDEPNQTGELTAKQASMFGVKYVIIGHSERRINQKEDKKVLINKFNQAINNKLNVIYCIGEDLVEYRLKDTVNVILSKLDEVISNVDTSKIKKLYIAYEPIWAIGSGMTPSRYEIENVIGFIRNYLNKNKIKAEILYGGSVNSENIESLNEIEQVDGFLVGGASCNSKEVVKMCEILMN